MVREVFNQSDLTRQDLEIPSPQCLQNDPNDAQRDLIKPFVQNLVANATTSAHGKSATTYDSDKDERGVAECREIIQT